MKAIEDRQRTGQRPVLIRSAAPGPATASRPSNETLSFAVRAAEEDGFCGECGQPLVGQAAARVWKESALPWWVWGLITLGVALFINFGLSAWQVAQERAAARNLLSGLSAWEAQGEGPSVRRAALRAGAPPGVADWYETADDQLNRALEGIGFALAAIVLGISLVTRRSVQHRVAGRVSSTSGPRPAALFAPILHVLCQGWALAEAITLAAFHLSAIAFLYLLSARLVAGEPPSLDVVHETLDRVIQILTRLPDVVR